MGTATKLVEQDSILSEIPMPVLPTVIHSAPIELGSPSEVAAMVKLRDDDAMLAAFMGEVGGKWFYDFTVGGKKVEGVSVIGADEFSRARAEQGYPIRFPFDQMRIEEVSENGERGIRATVVARDHRTGQEAPATAFYPHMASKEDGTKYFDRFASRKALSVAKRNAILDLVPQVQIITVLKERTRIIAASEMRTTEIRKEAIAALPIYKLTQEEQAKDLERSPYDTVGKGPTPHSMEMPFGKTKGTPIGEMEDADLEGAVKWAKEKGKYTEFVTAAQAVLKDRRAHAPEEYAAKSA